jgi:hypothetical protein
VVSHNSHHSHHNRHSNSGGGGSSNSLEGHHFPSQIKHASFYLNVANSRNENAGGNDIPANQQIFINQSNNIYILAKYGQTVSLPCIIYKERNQDLSNVHAIWHRLYEKKRPVVLSIGLQQLKQDMRYRVKVATLNRVRVNSNNMYEEPLAFSDAEHDEESTSEHSDLFKRDQPTDSQLVDNNINNNNSENDSIHGGNPKSSQYLIQNWQFEIRKLTYEDAGTYQCLLPLVKPISKNITLQVIRKLRLLDSVFVSAGS